MDSPIRKKHQKPLSERLIEKTLLLFTTVTVLTTLAIVYSLFSETFIFFREVSLFEFLTDTRWSPTLQPRHFGILPLLVGTGMIALGSSFISLPLGLAAAIYLSEYAPAHVRKVVKPVLELLAGIPSIVYGFFALTFITPILRSFLPDVEVFNALSASIAVGIMTLPLVASLSEDAMMAVPDSIRQGAYALGATKLEVAVHVVVPAALSSIGAAFVLAVSRAVGETMIVAIAAGQSPVLTLNPLKSIQTMTGFMVNLSLGDIQHGTIEYKTVYAVGAMLFLMTFAMNLFARAIITKYREEY